MCGFGVPDTQAWNLATSPWDTALLAIGWIKVGFCPIECFFRLVRQVETCSSGSQRARPERKHVHLYIYIYTYKDLNHKGIPLQKTVK